MRYELILFEFHFCYFVCLVFFKLVLGFVLELVLKQLLKLLLELVIQQLLKQHFLKHSLNIQMDKMKSYFHFQNVKFFFSHHI